MDHDQEFIKKLKRDDPDAAKWLSQFNEEWYGNRMNRFGDKAFHKTKEEKQEVYRQTNSRQRDLYSRGGRMSIDLYPHEETTFDPTDELIEYLDWGKDDSESSEEDED